MSGSAGSGTGGSGTGGRKKKPLEERSPVQVGDRVADKYVIEQLLAAGGMGIVVAARHETLNQQVAIKFLLPDNEHPQRTERFLREARAAARIESTKVCRVFDCGTHGGLPYMVMEHLGGHDLSHELKQRGSLPVAEAVDLLLQALEGVAEAHAVGIVHRDLKPSNLFIAEKAGRPREVKILDFGISKAAPGVDANVEDDLTGTAAMLGSPRYMSPEQVQSSKNVDSRTDIWSLGVILYQMLDGRSPFSGTTMGETISKVLLHVPQPLSETRGDVPAGVTAAINRCLARDREQRYRNVAELALALAPFGTAASQPSVQRITALLVAGQLPADGAQHAAPVASPAPVAKAPVPVAHHSEPSLGTVSPLTQSSQVADFRPKHRAPVVIGAALLVVGLFAFGLWWSLRLPPEPVAEAPRETASAAPALAPAPTPVASVTAPAPSAEPAPSATPSAPAASASATAAPAPKAPPVRVPAKQKKPADDILSESY